MDALQMLPAAPSSYHEAADRYERQQATSFPSSRGSAPVLPSIAQSVLSQGYPYEQPRPNRDLAAQLRTLQQHYTILDGDKLIIELLEGEPTLFNLLVEAVQPLQTAFGATRLFQIRAQHSDDDALLRVAVRVPADYRDDPERVLRSFDRDWWLDNCQRSGGALVFDYEIQDAV
jgi:hypothetical protein